ncbi:MAG: hypothetical protein JNN11_02725 [Candidatus Doudnabacteria bacterium]|nr:hypothetical protein [Candidatus Doudnabacteria bacterium]
MGGLPPTLPAPSVVCVQKKILARVLIFSKPHNTETFGAVSSQKFHIPKAYLKSWLCFGRMKMCLNASKQEGKIVISQEPEIRVVEELSDEELNLLCERKGMDAFTGTRYNSPPPRPSLGTSSHNSQVE